MSAEMLEFENGVQGMVLNLEEDSIGCAILGDYLNIQEGDSVKRLDTILAVPVGEALLGRVVTPLGEPMDGKGPISTDKLRPVEFNAPGIAARQPVKEPLQTGVKSARAYHWRP
jgi:F-type H+-transporting ATPase subunit alpha